MRSILTVTTARADGGMLVTADEVKSELQITSTDTDEYLASLLPRVSEIAETYCNRVFAVESVEETIRREYQDYAIDRIILRRAPVTAIASVVADDVDVDSSLYRFDADTGELFSVDASGYDCLWLFSKSVVVNYSAGYATIPGPVQQAVFDLVKFNQAARTRDPSLRSENILEGLYSYTLFNATDNVGGVPPVVANNLDRFRLPNV